MNRQIASFPLAALVVGALCCLAALALAGPDASGSVLFGATTALLFQLISFQALTAAFPERQLMVFGLGMLGRMTLVGAMAVVVVPLTGSAMAPTLLTLVSVLFATTVIEPLFLRPTNGQRG